MSRIHLTSEREHSELARWRDEGFRHEPTTSNIVTYGSPDRQYNITVEVDDPVAGYLVKLYRRDGAVLGRAIVEDKALATELAHVFAAYPDRYEGLDQL